MRFRMDVSLMLILAFTGTAQAAEPNGLSLRVPDAEKSASLTRPTRVEVECGAPGSVLTLFLDDRPVMVTNRPRTEWELDPAKVLKGAPGRRVKLSVTAYLSDGKKIVRSIFVQVGDPPILRQP